MLGFISGDEQVGYFTAGTKITHIGLTIISSLGTVLLPRCSHLLKIGDYGGFSTIINKSLNLTLVLSLPMMAGLMILAGPVTMIFCGEEYFDSIPILYLNAPVIVFISLTNVMGIQILYPKDKVNIVILSVTAGAVSNLVLNFILIPPYGAYGAAISTLIAEFMVLIAQIIYGRKYYPFRTKALFNRHYILATLIMSIIVYPVVMIFEDNIFKLIFGIIAGILAYTGSLICMRDSLTIDLISTIKNKLNHGKRI